MDDAEGAGEDRRLADRERFGSAAGVRRAIRYSNALVARPHSQGKKK